MITAVFTESCSLYCWMNEFVQKYTFSSSYHRWLILLTTMSWLFCIINFSIFCLQRILKNLNYNLFTCLIGVLTIGKQVLLPTFLFFLCCVFWCCTGYWGNIIFILFCIIVEDWKYNWDHCHITKIVKKKKFTLFYLL